MRYRKVNMDEAVKAALTGVMSIRADHTYEVGNVRQDRPGLALVTLSWPREVWWVCLSKDLAIEHGEAVIRDRLRDPSGFDGEWLLRFVPGDFHQHLDEAPGEVAKHRKVKALGIDVEAAAEDYRTGFRGWKDWLEGVFDAHSFTVQTFGSVVCWRVR